MNVKRKLRWERFPSIIGISLLFYHIRQTRFYQSADDVYCRRDKFRPFYMFPASLPSPPPPAEE